MATYISVDDIVYSEGDSSAVFTLRLSAPSPADITIDFATVGGTAIDGTHYTGDAGQVVILSGSTAATITVPLLTDGLLGATYRGFQLQLSTADVDVFLGNTTVNASLVEANAPVAATPVLTPQDVVVDESAGIVTVVVTLDAPSAGAVSVDFTTQNASASAGSDYSTTGGTLVIAAGSTVGRIEIPITADSDIEGRELFSVRFSNPVGATLADSVVNVVVQDSSANVESNPLINVQGATVLEDQGFVDFLVTLGAPAASAVTVSYGTTDGSALGDAQAGIDYMASTGTLTFAPGETSKVVRVQLIDNADVDALALRGFTLDLFGPGVGVLGTASARAELVDNEAGVTTTNQTANDDGQILRGTVLGDSLTGGAGNDLLDGRAASDTMRGGAGDDIYIVEQDGGTVDETDLVNFTTDAGGNDTVVTYRDVTNLTDFVETMILAGNAAFTDGFSYGYGNAQDNRIVGNDLSNWLEGRAGNDTLQGGAGNDTLYGGTGNDTYLVDDAGDAPVEYVGEGVDTVIASVSHTLGQNISAGNIGTLDFIDNLVLTGTADLNGTGNRLANQITGNSGNNRLDGRDGNDTLDGGAGNDTLEGGAGDDLYQVDAAGDVIVEAVGAGSDRVSASVNYTLGAGVSVETMSLSGSATSLTGNELDNALIGGALADTLVGMEGNDSLSGAAGNDSLSGGAGNDTLNGGAGNDTLEGGTGDDLYQVDSAGDVIVEVGSAGSDRVWASANYTLGAGVSVETMTLTGTATGLTGNELDNALYGGALADTLVGMAGNDSLNGGSGNDSLSGGVGNDTLNGGAGNDTLEGGTGDDLYQVDAAGDVIVEAVGAGSDRVSASVNYTLGAGVSVETMSLSGSATSLTGNELDNALIGGALADTLVGMEGNDSLSGAAGNDSLSGGAGNDTLNGGAGNDTLEGGTGDDLYQVDSAGDVIVEVGSAGSDRVWASANYTLGAGVSVETMTLTGTATGLTGNELDNALYGGALADTLLGMAGNDRLNGGAGNDTLNGGAGNDTLEGGTGDDLYQVDSAGDVIVEVGSAGSDRVWASANYTLGAGVSVETMTLTGTATGLTGNELDNALYGGALADTLLGMAGNDRLNGGAGNDTLNGGAGTDTLEGGAGDDLYQVDAAADVIVEVGSAGSDRVWASANYTLGAGVSVETMTLTGTATGLTGNELDNALYGGALADTLVGMAGNDSLNGGSGNDSLSGGVGNDTLNGGAGTDTLEGGTGDDLYQVDSAGDVIVEAVGAGSDRVSASVNYTLGAGVSVETMSLSGSATALTGNELDNALIGGALADTLVGMEGNDSLNGGSGNDSLNGGVGNDTLDGGAGNDTLEGGAGDDLYQVDAAGDVIVEAVGAGSDRVSASVNYTLGVGVSVETMSLSGSATSLTGNELDNALIGGALADTLVGMEGNDSLSGAAGNDSLSGGAGNDTLNGGAGTDTLEGGTGDDLYQVDSAADVIVEVGSAGSDRVWASANYTLGAGVSVETMTLTGTATGLTGNELDNALYGGALADTLVGMAGNDSLNGGSGNDSLSGGVGNDTLTGGLGNDLFVFDTTPNATSNVDRITDFTAGDHIQLAAGTFNSLTAGGTLASAQFFSGAGVTGAGAGQVAGIYYNTSTGALYYDADGAGGSSAVQFAAVSGNPGLAAADFVVIV